MDNFDDRFLDSELVVSPEIKEVRLLTCLVCDRYTPPTCSECYCLIGLMVSYSFKSCPIGKW